MSINLNNLPIEIINVIINFINLNDSFIASLVCKGWLNMIQNRNITDKIILYNDSFYISHNINKINETILYQIINNIITPNCLNIIAYNIINSNIFFLGKSVVQYFKLALIKQFCIINSTNIHKYSDLIFISQINAKIIINKMLKWCLLNDSYDVANFVLGFGPKVNRWAMYIIKHFVCINDNIKKSLDYLIKNNSINLPEFYREMLLLKQKSQLCHDIGKYVKYNINEDVRKHIKNNLHNYTSFVIFYVY
jgi:hypothetical protein